MNRIYSIYDTRNLSVVARNMKDGEKLNVQLTLLDKNMKELAVIKDIVPVVNYQVKYPFSPEKLAKLKGVDPEKVAFIKGWIDANEDGVADYEEQIVYQVGVLDIVGIRHIESTNESYLITIQDLKDLEDSLQADKNLLENRDYYNLSENTKEKMDEIKKKTRINPVNEFAKNNLTSDDVLSNFIKGFASVGGYLYAFGDFAARYTGFRDKQQCSQSVISDLECSSEQDKIEQDIVFTKKLTQAIATNENGAGEIFAKSVKKYIAQNRAYFGGRAVGTGIIAKRITDKHWIDYKTKNEYGGKQRDVKLFNKASSPISLTGSYMDTLYYLRNIDTSVSVEEITPEIIDLYAKYIVLGQ